MISKKLKDFTRPLMINKCDCPEGDHNCSKLMRPLRAVARFYMFNVYYPIHDFFTRITERVGRSLSWAKFAYLNYDFDSVYLYTVMSFKLKRLYLGLKSGTAVQEKEDMEALKELIKVCDRLSDQSYEDKHLSQHDKKWGRMPRFGSTPNKDVNGKITSYTMVFKDRPKVKNKRQKEQERKEFRECFEKGEVDRIKDIDRMAEILKKHATHWWD
jgi:hypothetical protein